MLRIVVIVGLLALPAQADLVSHAVVRYGDAATTVDEHFGTTGATASLIYTTPGLFHGVGEAAAGYGDLHATATVLGVSAAYPINTAQAEAGFSDLLTVSGPTGTGYVIYTYSISGWATGESSLGALFLRHGIDPDEELDDEIVGGEVFQSQPHGIVFGEPFTHGVILQANGRIGLGETGEFGSDLEAVMTGLEVFDAAMNPIADFTVRSASGTAYPVPAPMSALLLAAGACLLGSRRRGRPLLD